MGPALPVSGGIVSRGGSCSQASGVEPIPCGSNSPTRRMRSSRSAWVSGCGGDAAFPIAFNTHPIPYTSTIAVMNSTMIFSPVSFYHVACIVARRLVWRWERVQQPASVPCFGPRRPTPLPQLPQPSAGCRKPHCAHCSLPPVACCSLSLIAPAPLPQAPTPAVAMHAAPCAWHCSQAHWHASVLSKSADFAANGVRSTKSGGSVRPGTC